MERVCSYPLWLTLALTTTTTATPALTLTGRDEKPGFRIVVSTSQPFLAAVPLFFPYAAISPFIPYNNKSVDETLPFRTRKDPRIHAICLGLLFWK